jgi:hypothetical protein
MASTPCPSRLERAVLVAPVFAFVLAVSGCAVVSVAATAVSVAGSAAGAVVSVGGAVVSSTVHVAGKAAEKTIDLVTPGSAPAAPAK